MFFTKYINNNGTENMKINTYNINSNNRVNKQLDVYKKWWDVDFIQQKKTLSFYFCDLSFINIFEESVVLFNVILFN